MGHKIDVIFNGPINKPGIAFGHRRQIDRHTGNIDAFPGTYYPSVAHLANQCLILFLEHMQFDLPVVDQHDRTDRYIPAYHCIIQINTLPARHRILVGSLQQQPISRRYGNSLGKFGRHACYPDLRPLGINDDSDLFGNTAYVFDNFGGTLRGQVGRVDPYGVHSGFVQRTYKLGLAMSVRDGCNYFGPFIHTNADYSMKLKMPRR